MAKGTTFQILGAEKDIRKVPDHRGKLTRFGIDVELTFADGRKKQYTYKSNRKRDVIAAMQPGGWISKEAQAAKLDERGYLSFCFSIDLCGGGLKACTD
jgi:hypothetical protein